MLQQHIQHAPYFWTHIMGFVAGGGLVRALAYISNAVPPLPAGSGWWAQFGYGLLKGVTGVDPNTTPSK